MQDVDVLFPFLSAFVDFGKALDSLSVQHKLSRVTAHLPR